MRPTPRRASRRVRLAGARRVERCLPGNDARHFSKCRETDLRLVPPDRLLSGVRVPRPRRMARDVPAEISEEASPEGVDVNALPLTGWPAFKEKFLACFWELEEHLADLFGLNDSKYQWAVDQYMEEREAQKDAEDFAAFEREQEAEMENARVAQETDMLEGGEAAAATAPLTAAAR